MQTKLSQKEMPNGETLNMTFSLDLDELVKKVGKSRVEEIMLQWAIAHPAASAIKAACATANGLDGAAESESTIADHKALWVRAQNSKTVFNVIEFFPQKREVTLEGRISALMKKAKKDGLSADEKAELVKLQSDLIASM